MIGALLLSVSVALVISEEGFRANPYHDTLGYVTVGYGQKLSNKMMDDLSKYESVKEPDARADLNHKIVVINEKLTERYGKVYTDLSITRKAILISMKYQIGGYGLSKFRDMWKAIEKEDFEAASEAMKDSVWYEQTPARVLRHSKDMRSD